MRAFIFVLLVAAAFAEDAEDIESKITCEAPFVPVYIDPWHVDQVCIFFDVSVKLTWTAAQDRCVNVYNSTLAEPKGHLHYEIVQLIEAYGYTDEGFWIGGTDMGHLGTWTWILGDEPMPVPQSTPHWYPCNPQQPDDDANSNYACIFTPDFYYHSCQNDILIRPLCQRFV